MFKDALMYTIIHSIVSFHMWFSTCAQSISFCPFLHILVSTVWTLEWQKTCWFVLVLIKTSLHIYSIEKYTGYSLNTKMCVAYASISAPFFCSALIHIYLLVISVFLFIILHLHSSRFGLETDAQQSPSEYKKGYLTNLILQCFVTPIVNFHSLPQKQSSIILHSAHFSYPYKQQPT